MKKWTSALAALAVLGTPALAQVRPQDCRPVLPVVDQAAQAVPQDVLAEQAAPAVAAKRGFFGLPFLPLLLAAGGAAVLGTGGDGGNDGEVVSPA
jgi:hypothetical protein